MQTHEKRLEPLPASVMRALVHVPFRHATRSLAERLRALSATGVSKRRIEYQTP